MATSKEYIEFVCEQIYRYGAVTYRKMFGEYMVYVNDKPLLTVPILLVCDNTVYIKEFPELDGIMSEAERGIPYDGVKERYILDIEDSELLDEVIPILERLTEIPKKKNRRTK